MPTSPVRDWFLMSECQRILGISYQTLLGLLESYPIPMEKTGDGEKAITLVYMPTLKKALAFDSFDKDQALDLMSEAWDMVDTIAGQNKGVNITDCKILAARIKTFIERYR